jgi:aspartate racemase
MSKGAGGGAQPVLGVLGGMGPDATVELMQRIIRRTPARDDADHIRMIVDNNPKVPSRIKALIEGTGEDPGPVLAQMARGLEQAGATLIAMPCNTAHHYLPVIRRAVSAPVLDMIDLAIARLQAIEPPVRVIGILGSPAVRTTHLLDGRLEAAGLTALFPEPEADSALLGAIRAVKAGDLGPAPREAYSRCAEDLKARGAEALLIACTELSALGSPAIANCPAVDTLDALVDEVLAGCLKHDPEKWEPVFGEDHVL